MYDERRTGGKGKYMDKLGEKKGGKESEKIREGKDGKGSRKWLGKESERDSKHGQERMEKIEEEGRVVETI